jgi:nicotinate phosphoribosyltransferase
VSGGLGEKDLGPLAKAGVDGFGVGTSISNAPVIDYAMDIVEKDGKAVAKRGKFSGRKKAFRCAGCNSWAVSTDEKVPTCHRCGAEMKLAEVQLLRNGNRTSAAEPAQAIRERVLDQLNGLQLE